MTVMNNSYSSCHMFNKTALYNVLYTASIGQVTVVILKINLVDQTVAIRIENLIKSL